MADSFELEKKIWTESDFDIMDWHDSPVYSLAFYSEASSLTTELMFDIGYIFKWIDPIPPTRNFSFWIAPATIVFKNVYNLSIQISQTLLTLRSRIFTDWSNFLIPKACPIGNGMSNYKMVIYTLIQTDSNSS
jgi:hypothetical protein